LRVFMNDKTLRHNKNNFAEGGSSNLQFSIFNLKF
jgi:hypothetical protein